MGCLWRVLPSKRDLARKRSPKNFHAGLSERKCRYSRCLRNKKLVPPCMLFCIKQCFYSKRKLDKDSLNLGQSYLARSMPGMLSRPQKQRSAVWVKDCSHLKRFLQSCTMIHNCLNSVNIYLPDQDLLSSCLNVLAHAHIFLLRH